MSSRAPTTNIIPYNYIVTIVLYAEYRLLNLQPGLIDMLKLLNNDFLS